MASTTASAAKISRPKVSGVYPRMRVFTELDGLAGAPISWISSPPGAGKTTLISHYLEERGLNTLWYQVDEDDSDPSTFFYYLGLAGRHATPKKRKELPLLTPEYQLGIPTFTRNFFRTLFERFDRKFALVLDNFQELDENSELHAILITGFEQPPPDGRVFIISRTEPPPRYARLRANNGISELNWDQIALDTDELAAVLKLKGRAELPIDSVMAVTQGWMAGLILLLNHEPIDWIANHTAEFNPKVLFDYFAGEVYERTDTDTRKFLTKTALLPKMTAAMAAQLTGVRDATEILEQLAGRNYFVHRHIGKVTEYQYHPLFLEFLNRKARESLTAVELTARRWQAAEILSAGGQVEAAVDLLFEVSDWKQIARLIEASAESLLRQGRHKTLERWLEQIPAEELDSDPWLSYWLAMSKRQFKPAEAYPLFRAALEGFRKEKNSRGVFLAWSYAARASREARQSSTADYIEWDRLLREVTKEYPDYPDPNIEAMVATTMYDIVTWAMPLHPQREFWERRFEELLPRMTDKAMKFDILAYTAICDCILGNHLRAGRLIEQAERLVDPATPLGALAELHIAKPFYLWRSDQNEAAIDATFAALRFADETGIHIWDEHYVGHGLSGALKIGDLARADTLVARALRIIDDAAGFRAAHLNYAYGWYLFQKGELQKAEHFVSQGVSKARQSGSIFFCGISLFAHANLLYELGRPQEVREALAEALQIARDGAFRASIVQCNVLAAYFAILDGNDELACEHLREGLGWAREHDIKTYSWWRNEVWSVVACVALRNNIETEHVRDIVRRNRLTPEVPPLELDAWPWEATIFAFGHCELFVRDEPVKFSRKAQKKPMQLIRALVAMGGSDVPETRIIEALWPDAEADAAHTAFATTLHRVRKLFGNDIIVHSERRLGLDRRRVWTDVWAFEHLLDQFDAGDPIQDLKRRREILERALSLYRGHFLAEEMDSAWALPLREKLRTRFLLRLEEFGQILEQKEEWDQAIKWYRKGLEVDMLAEQFYQRLMRCYQCMDRKADAVEIYRQCYRVLVASLNVEPSKKTQQLYREINA